MYDTYLYKLLLLSLLILFYVIIIISQLFSNYNNNFILVQILIECGCTRDLGKVLKLVFIVRVE